MEILDKSFEINSGHNNRDLYNAAGKWLLNFANSAEVWPVARFDYTNGFSMINSVMYASAIYFKYKEDYVAFKLIFGDLLKF
jgi:hypothetical protein